MMLSSEHGDVEKIEDDDDDGGDDDGTMKRMMMVRRWMCVMKEEGVEVDALGMKEMKKMMGLLKRWWRRQPWLW